MSARPGAAAVLLTLTLAACGKAPAEQTTTSAAPISVTAVRVAAVSVAERLEAGGVVAASTSATIASRITAPVVAVRARAGTRVRAGDVVIELDDRSSAARAREAEASVDAAEQALRGARSELAATAAEQTLATAYRDRIAALHASRAATTQELDEATARMATVTARHDGAEARIAQATAQLGAARAAVDEAVTARSFATIRSPFDGVVTDTMTDPGNLATPGAPLARIDASGGRRVDVKVDAARAGFLHVGDRVEVVVDAAPQPRALDGVITEMSRAVAADQVFTVKVSIPAAGEAASGTFARLRFSGASRRTLTVPAGAIRRSGQVVTVFVIDGGLARLRLVTVGDTSADGVEIRSGLDAGETVVVDPPPALVDGARVTVGPGPPAAGGSR